MIAAFVLAGIRIYTESYTIYQNPECVIEYGEGECIEGKYRIPFHNPNEKEITSIRINVPFGIKTNITLPADFKVTEPLKSRETGVLTLFPCEEDVDIRYFSVDWCCFEGCYSANMIMPNEQIKIVK